MRVLSQLLTPKSINWKKQLKDLRASRPYSAKFSQIGDSLVTGNSDWNWGGYSALIKYSPSAEAVAAASDRFLLSSNVSIHATGFSPRPISNNVPIIFRTMWCKKPSAWISSTNSSPCWINLAKWTWRTGWLDWQEAARKPVSYTHLRAHET